MIKPRLFLCSGAKLPNGNRFPDNREIIELDAVGPEPSVHIRLEDVAKVFLQNIQPRLTDLLEIASYVYAADCATRRGEEWVEDSIEPWERDFHFIIPVRELEFWRRDGVKELLQDILKFLSNDKYAFEFCPLQKERPLQEYIELGEQSDWPFYGVDRVLMFSGGLDSLAGAAETAAQGKKLVLVSHRPVSTMHKRQKELFRDLRKTYPVPMIHVPVWINKSKKYG